MWGREEHMVAGSTGGAEKHWGDLIHLKEETNFKGHRSINPHVREKVPLSSLISKFRSDDEKHSSLWNSVPRDTRDTIPF